MFVAVAVCVRFVTHTPAILMVTKNERFGFWRKLSTAVVFCSMGEEGGGAFFYDSTCLRFSFRGPRLSLHKTNHRHVVYCGGGAVLRGCLPL